MIIIFLKVIDSVLLAETAPVSDSGGVTCFLDSICQKFQELPQEALSPADGWQEELSHSMASSSCFSGLGGVMGWPWVDTNFSAFITYDFCFPGNIRESQVASTAHQMGESSELEGQPQNLHMLQARFYFK